MDHTRDIEENKLLDEIDTTYDPEKRSITDKDWSNKGKKWDKAKKRWLKEVIDGVVWDNDFTVDDLFEANVPSSEVLGEDDGANTVVTPSQTSENVPVVESGLGQAPSDYSASVASDDVRAPVKETPVVDEAAVLDARAAPQPFLKKNLWKYLEVWDKASAGKRDKIIWEFIRSYTWKHPMDMEHLFCCGGSLLFTRFTVGLQMAYMKRQRVPHYFMALKIFIRSLQGAEYTMQFASMGAIFYIFEVVRVSETCDYDKKQALVFLLELMEGANGPGIKYFICSNQHYLESLVDFLTMCHNTSVIFQCRRVLEALCTGNTMANIGLVSKFVMAMIPCDFNPKIQSLAFRVLQGIVRVNPEMAKLCLKPLQDNLKTEDSSLIVEMGELVLVIMKTDEADGLIELLIASATGIRLKEEFESWNRLYQYKPSSANEKTLKYSTKLQTGSRDAWEKSMAKKNRKDNYHQQSGAIFILNHMIRNRPELVGQLIHHGIFGISLKALGASPHWQVQSQGVKLLLSLNELSVDCSLSYYLMIPRDLMECIIRTSEDCLKAFTSPICLCFRKLGRFTLKMWHDWMQKIVQPAKNMFQGKRKSKSRERDYLPIDNFIGQKVEKIYLELEKLWENPILEAAPCNDEDLDDISKEEPPPSALLTLSQDDMYKMGKKQIAEDPKLEPFKKYLDLHNSLATDFHDDFLDARIDDQYMTIANINTANNDRDLGGVEMALLMDAENVMDKFLHPGIEEEVISGEEEEEPSERSSASDAFQFKL